MRIARVLTRLNLGGPARQVLASDPLLVERGHSVRVYAGQPEAGEGDLFEEARRRGLDVVRVPGLKRGVAPASDWRASRALRRALREQAPDVLHTHASKAGTLGRMAARDLAGTACVHTFHGHVLEGYFPAAVSQRLIAHERRLARRSDRIVAVSHATAEDLLRLEVAQAEQLVVVPPGIDLGGLLALERSDQAGPLRRLCGAGPEDYVVGVIGRLAAVKQPEVALEVFATLAARHAHLHLVYVGDGSERRSLERAIGELPPGVAERAHMLGAREEMAPVLGELDCVLSSSHSEGLPVAMIEAAAAGLPVVSTAVGGVPEVVAHERTGLLGEDATELAFHLDALVADPELGRAMGARARLRVEARHSARALADRLEALYHAVVEERACAS